MHVQQPIEAFCSLVYPSGSSRIALCLIPPGSMRSEHRFTSVRQLFRFLPYARFRNAHGWGIYVTPSTLKPNANNRRKESFLEHQQVIYLDCDQPSCLATIKRRYPYPTLVVRTSRGRHQVYWRLDAVVTAHQQQQLMRRLAADVQADRSATDVSPAGDPGLAATQASRQTQSAVLRPTDGDAGRPPTATDHWRHRAYGELIQPSSTTEQNHRRNPLRYQASCPVP